MSAQRPEQRPTGGGSGTGLRGGPMAGSAWGAMGRPVEKARDFRGTQARLLGYLGPHRLKLGAVFVFAIGGTLFNVVGPALMGQATTTIFRGFAAKHTAVRLGRPIPPIDFATVGHIVLILLGLYVVSALFTYLQQVIMAGVAQTTVYAMRRDVDRKLARLPLRFFDARTHGEILSRVTNDLDTIATTLQQSLTQLITSLVTIVGVIVMMLIISPLLTLIVLVTLPLYVVVARLVAKRSQRYFAAQQKELGQLNGHVEEMYTRHTIVKAFLYEAQSIQRFNAINDSLYVAGWKAQFVSGIIMPLMTLVSNLGYVLVSVVGGVLVTGGHIAIGD